jgi:hypothetical protein
VAISPSFDPNMFRPVELPPMRHPAPNVTQSAPASDSLQIVDHFTPTLGPELPLIPDRAGALTSIRTIVPPHGVNVTEGALETGFQGPINGRQAQTNPNIAAPLLSSPFLQRDQVDGLLRDYVRLEQTSMLRTGSMALVESLQAGSTQQVTNLSLTASPSNTTRHMYNDIRANWQPVPENESEEQRSRRERGGQLMNNLADAWNIPLESLNSTDTTVSGPARQQFQQRLINQVAEAGNDPMMQEGRALYSRLVDEYEARNNSVVVAAGNDGELLGSMREDNGGRDLTTPAGFFDNPLAVPNATTVGSLDVTPTGVGVAPYSSPSGQVDVHAWGNLSSGQSGTSFASPRVGAMMQRLHHENPQATSDEVQQMMIRRFFSTETPVPSERQGAVQEYMRSQTW